MNELQMLQTVLEKALQKADELKAKRVTNLYFVIGELSDHKDDSVQSSWNQISPGTLAEGAALHVRHIQAEVQCMSCFEKYRPQHNKIDCPNCGGVGAKILAGEEFYIESFDLE
jgi:hydrogenase nickel incorporation protein HypA/HybF